MTREEFKRRWELDDTGDGITFDDIAQCAVDWGICSTPKTRPVFDIRDQVLATAGVCDASGEEEG